MRLLVTKAEQACVLVQQSLNSLRMDLAEPRLPVIRVVYIARISAVIRKSMDGVETVPGDWEQQVSQAVVVTDAQRANVEQVGNSLLLILMLILSFFFLFLFFIQVFFFFFFFIFVFFFYVFFFFLVFFFLCYYY